MEPGVSMAAQLLNHSVSLMRLREGKLVVALMTKGHFYIEWPFHCPERLHIRWEDTRRRSFQL